MTDTVDSGSPAIWTLFISHNDKFILQERRTDEAFLATPRNAPADERSYSLADCRSRSPSKSRTNARTHSSTPPSMK